MLNSYNRSLTEQKVVIKNKKRKDKCFRCSCGPHCDNNCKNCENCDVCDCPQCLLRFAPDG